VSTLLSFFNGLAMHMHCLSACAPAARYRERLVLFAVVPFSDASKVCRELSFESGPLFNGEESN
jgi:hypothetical protein